MLAAQAEIPELVLTHFWPEYNLDIIRDEAESGFGRPATVAREGLVIEVNAVRVR